MRAYGLTQLGYRRQLQQVRAPPYHRVNTYPCCTADV